MKSEILPLTSLRGIAALWVVTTHITMGTLNGYLPMFSEKTDFGIFRMLIANGSYAVDFFFILSGFIMCYVYQEKLTTQYNRKNFYNFYIARFARLWPVTTFYTVILYFLFTFGLWRSERDIGLANYITSIFFLDFTLGLDTAINMPAWSISIEFFAYLLFPLFLIVLKSNIKSVFTVFIIIFLSILYAYLQSIYGLGWINSPFFMIMRVSIGFFIGCQIYSLYKKNPSFINTDRLFIFMLIIFLFLGIFFPITYLMYPLIPWLILFLASSKKYVCKFMSTVPLVYLGKISFSIYLVHYPFIELAEALFGQQLSDLNAVTDQFLIYSSLLGMIIVVIILASLSYHFIEVPSRNYIKKHYSIQN